LHLKGFYGQFISLAIYYITFLLHLKGFCDSIILLASYSAITEETHAV